MFDIGMGEIALIAVIALLVLGPERLPKAARTVGALLRKARNSWQSVRGEIERELAAEELKRNFKQTVAAADPSNEVQTIPSPVPPLLSATHLETPAKNIPNGAK